MFNETLLLFTSTFTPQLGCSEKANFPVNMQRWDKNLFTLGATPSSHAFCFDDAMHGRYVSFYVNKGITVAERVYTYPFVYIK